MYELTHEIKASENYYIIFTSGTTGRPKSVQISHDNLLSYTNWMLESEVFAVPQAPQMLAQPPYSFDLSGMYWAPTLTLGGTLFPISSEETSKFKQLYLAISNLPIQIWTSTPSFVDLAFVSDNFNAKNYPSIEAFYFDGEELTVKTAKNLKSRFPNARIINAYGPTEATVAISAIEINNLMIERNERLPIGIPNPAAHILILNDHGEVSSENQIGEIIITGPTVSKGYLYNAMQTDRSFFKINDHWAYRSGDLGRIDQNGVLYYNGRIDFKIKLNGYQIELEEVSQTSLIESAVAIPRYDRDKYKVKQLLAYIVLHISY